MLWTYSLPRMLYFYHFFSFFFHFLFLIVSNVNLINFSFFNTFHDQLFWFFEYHHCKICLEILLNSPQKSLDPVFEYHYWILMRRKICLCVFIKSFSSCFCIEYQFRIADHRTLKFFIGKYLFLFSFSFSYFIFTFCSCSISVVY